MFKFNFKTEEDSDNPFVQNDETKDACSGCDSAQIDWYEAQQILPNENILKNLNVCRLNARNCLIGNTTVSHIISGCLPQDTTTEDDIQKAEESHSDLLPGIYEGGAKIWECTHDLLNHLAENYTTETWQGKRVLDLGCGSGLLGIYAYKCGANVDFQDYNKDVLEKVTLPNFLLNVDKSNLVLDLAVTKFYSGDWHSFAELTKKEDAYDVILTSETIYNPQNQQKLLDTLHAKLKPDGVVLLATKTYYFGVGGGARQFQELICEDKRFQSKVLWVETEGISREIIELKTV